MTEHRTDADRVGWRNQATARRRLLGGGAWGAAGYTVSVLLGLPLTIALVRVLPHGAYGSLAVALSLCSLIGSVVSLGIGDGLARVLSAGPDDPDAEVAGLVATGFRLAGAGAAVGALATVGLSFALEASRTSGSSRLVLVGAPLAVAAPFSSLFLGLARSAFRPKLVFLSTISSSAIALVAIGLCLIGGVRTATPVMISRVGAACVALGVVGGPFLWRRPWVGKSSRAAARSICVVGGAVMTVSLAAIAVSELDIAVVGMFRGSTAAGVYAPLSKLMDVVTGAFAAIGTYVLAALSAAASQGDDDLRRQYHWSSRWVLVALGPVLAVLLVEPGLVIRVLFGLHGHEASTLVRIMAAAAVGHVLLGYNGLCLIAFGEARLVLLQGAGALGMSLIACFTLVPLFGLYGAAVSTALALLTSNAIASISLSRRHGIGPLDRAGVGTLGAWVVSTGVATAAAGVLGIGLLGAVATFVIVLVGVGAGALIASGGRSAEELQMLRSALARLGVGR